MKPLTSRLLLAMVLLLAAALPQTTRAQGGGNSAAANQTGIYLLYQLVMHDANFGGMPGVPCCSPEFTSTNGPGFAAGVLYQLRLADMLALQMRGGYSIFTGSMQTEENIGNTLDANGNDVDAFSMHTLETTISQVTLEPMLVVAPFSFPLAVNLGARAGLTVASNYDQSERLDRPSNVTFSDGSIERNVASAAIPDESGLYVGAIGGLSYDISLGGGLILAPEASYNYNFNQVIADTTWSISALRFGVALKLGLEDEIAPPPPEAPFTVSLNAAGLYPLKEGGHEERRVVELVVEEFFSPQLRPLLNYVFFDENSSTIPARYHRIDPSRTDAFRIDRLYQLDGVETYHHLLNIVGKRMRENPDATLRLVGTNSNRGPEQNNTALSQSRAEAVRNYLRDVWSIPEGRLRVEARNLPETPSNNDIPDGIQENRRVELYSDNLRILDPVLTDDTLRQVSPPGIRFRPSAAPAERVNDWRISASQHGSPIRSFPGSGPVPTYIDWDLQSDQQNVPRAETPLEYQLSVSDRSGRTASTPIGELPVQQITLRKKRVERVADREINRYSLILFDFGKANITEQNARIIEMIRNRISLDAHVSIVGHTDRVGEEAFNKRLSTDRATAVGAAIGSANPTVRGDGESPHLFDNDLPEGRFYSRTVNIVVETPIVE